MASIAELRARLAKAQQKVAKPRLSTSQCIDILLKVCQKQNITLVPTLNGDELVTGQQLEIEAIATLDAHGGRIGMAELAATLGVQRNYVDRAVERIFQDDPGSYMQWQDTIITTEYIDKLMVIANSRLQECGILNVCDFASEFELPFDMLKALVNKTKFIEGKLNGNVLESRVYEGSKGRCVVAALVATTVPTLSMHIATTLKLDVNLVNDILNKALKEGTLSGTFKGGLYTPKVYTDHREASLLAFYNASGYIERKRVADVSWSNHNLFANAVTLETLVIDKKLIEPVSVLVNEAIANASWSTLSILLPAAVTESDLLALLGHIKGATNNGYIVEGVYVTNSFEDSILKHLLNLIKERESPQKLLDQASKDSDKLYDELSTLMEQDPGSNFAEFWSTASSGFFERVQLRIIAMLKASIVELSSGSKNNLSIQDLTELLKTVYMKFMNTLKVVEKLCNGEADNSHLIMKTMAKELMPTDCHALLQYYATQNRIEIPGDGSQVVANNRNAVIEGINDREVKDLFEAYVGALKQKDTGKCIDISKSLRAAMYISCNIKNEKKAFFKTQTTHYKQQLAVLTKLDSLKVAYCVLNLALLKNGHYLFLVEKDWCLKGCLEAVEGMVNDHDLMKNLRSCLETQDTEATEACRKKML